MALFQKLFLSRKNQDKNQDNASEKLFAFTKEQVRVMLFKECDFRGRKLLFDSDAVKKVPLDSSSNAEFPVETKEKTEIHSGYGYKYSKPHPEFNQILEMIFGTVAMSFRGTYFKIHSLSSPQRLMFSQVFPSPHHTTKRTSNSSRTCPRTSTQSFEHSSKMDDSGASSTNSVSEQLSVHSTTSDTILVSRRQHSCPLDVPKHATSASNPSIIGDSGCGDQSYSSFSSGPDSLPPWDMLVTNSGTFSSGSDYRKWLRSTSTSLDHSGTSLTGSTSIDDHPLKGHHKSKLGLALIVEITPDQEETLVHFLMEHVALIESILWRSRQKVEVAHIRPQSFLPIMLDVADLSAQWLLNLLSGPRLSRNLWLSLSTNCDNNNSINAFRGITDSEMCVHEAINNSSDSSSSAESCGGLECIEKRSFFNLSLFFKSVSEPITGRKCAAGSVERTLVAEKFLREFCELLDTVDVKSTNFFVSTLLTAVLTHHLGWVATCLPPETNNECVKIQMPFNALWGQLSDLFGAVGHPTKMTRTIVSGTNKKDVITKILNSLTYFIRCCEVERKFISRLDMDKENSLVEDICLESSCIPKENYKKYEDHLREMMVASHFCNEKMPKCDFDEVDGFCKPSEDCMGDMSKIAGDISKISVDISKISGDISKLSGDIPKIPDNISKVAGDIQRPKKGLVKSQTCVNSLFDMSQCQEESFEKRLDNGLQNTGFKDTFLCENKENLFFDKECFYKSDIRTQSQSEGVSKNVIFVLGDNDELVGLKKENFVPEKSSTEKELEACPKSKLRAVKSSRILTPVEDFKSKNNIESCSKKLAKRPSFLNLKIDKSTKHGSFSDEDFVLNNVSPSHIKPSTSWSSPETVQRETKHSKRAVYDLTSTQTTYASRSQSVPPEEQKGVKQDVMKSKYRYGGYKFTLQQYPQILENYLRSKNLEIASFQFGDKTGFKQFSVWENGSDSMGGNNSDDEEIETLQTPSNASEMEFTADLMIEKPRVLHARESSVEPVPQSMFVKGHNSTARTYTEEDGLEEQNRKTAIRKMLCYDCNYKTDKNGTDVICSQQMRVINLPMPKSVDISEKVKPFPYTSSLIQGCVDNYMPDIVLQGTTSLKTEWENHLKSDLVLASKHSLLDQPVEEAVAIVANLDTWEVQLISSHTYVIDKGSSGIRVGMSQLVASMLESLLHMWKLKASPDFCLMHIEQRLQELCIRSKALAQLLLTTEFCSMEHLTSTLHLEVNDVPLLMAVASTHSPQVTQKYGLSFV